jgi:hypothetical protein
MSSLTVHQINWTSILVLHPKPFSKPLVTVYNLSVQRSTHMVYRQENWLSLEEAILAVNMCSILLLLNGETEIQDRYF